MKSPHVGVIVALMLGACVAERPTFGTSDASTQPSEVAPLAEAGEMFADGGASTGDAGGQGSLDVTLASGGQTSNYSTASSDTGGSEADGSREEVVDASTPSSHDGADAHVNTEQLDSGSDTVPSEAGTSACDGTGECIDPGLAQLGSPCIESSDCGSNHCAVDTAGNQVCCDAACDAPCTACSAEGHCDATPTEDADCGPLECDESTACITYPPALATGTCGSFGQCASVEDYCIADLASAGDECGDGLICDGEGACVVDCPDTSGPERQCTSDCPCAAAEGVCTSDDECLDGLVCTPDAVTKLDFPSSSCLPEHCVNDEMDEQETSVDCGGGCGCRATYEVVTISGVPADANFGQLSAMSGNGNAFAGNIGRDNGRFGDPYVARIDAAGVVTELLGFGMPGSGRGINADGSVIVGDLYCEDPPTCENTSYYRAFRWVNDAEPTPVFSIGSALVTSATGAISAGTQYDPETGDTTAFRASSTSYLNIPELNTVAAMSSDGEFIVGRSSSAEEGAMWSFTEQGTIALNPPSEWTSWGISVLSDDGSVFAGGAYSDTAQPAYIWRNGVFSDFPMLPGADYNLINGMSSEGSIAAGLSGTNSVQRAFLWDETNGIRTVLDEVETRGLELPADLELITVDFLSDDGRILVGSINAAETPSFWRVTLLD